MKIERINDNKIMITLSIHDLKERNLDYDSLSYNSPQAQELFWDMMHQAEVEYGFSGSDAQLFIEASHGLGGNLVITVTRVEEDGDFESIQKYIKSRFKKSDLKVRKKGKKLSSGIFIYSFDEFEDLCSVASVITDTYYGDSTLYKSGELFYLLLTNTGIASTNPDYFDSIMSEYGKKVSNSAFIEGYLNEYGAKMIEYDALQVLKDYFN